MSNTIVKIAFLRKQSILCSREVIFGFLLLLVSHIYPLAPHPPTPYPCPLGLNMP